MQHLKSATCSAQPTHAPPTSSASRSPRSPEVTAAFLLLLLLLLLLPPLPQDLSPIGGKFSVHCLCPRGLTAAFLVTARFASSSCLGCPFAARLRAVRPVHQKNVPDTGWLARPPPLATSPPLLPAPKGTEYGSETAFPSLPQEKHGIFGSNFKFWFEMAVEMTCFEGFGLNTGKRAVFALSREFLISNECPSSSTCQIRVVEKIGQIRLY